MQSGLTQSFQRRAGDTLLVGIKCIDWALATLGTPPHPLEVAGQVNHPLAPQRTDLNPRPTSRCHPRSWRKRRQHHQVVSTLLSHTSIPKNVCTISTCCASGLSTPCTWEPSTSTNPCCQPFPGDTPSPSAGRERQENIWTPCRKRRHRDARWSISSASCRSGQRRNVVCRHLVHGTQVHRPFHVTSRCRGHTVTISLLDTMP